MKKLVIKILIIVAVILLFVVMCVFTFVDFDSCKKNNHNHSYSINYKTTEGGRIEGNINQIVGKGKDAETVTAIANDGYRFLRWADTSSPNPMRTDTNIESDLNPQAKFVKISDIKFKILLVYVTEVQATFADIDGNDIIADYKMTEDDLIACRMITELFDICLNEMFDGLVTFEIDEYYTTAMMKEENFQYTVDNIGVDTVLYAENIPEVADKLNSYGSYITTVPLTYTEDALTYSVGVAKYKSASVRYEMNMPSNLHLGYTDNSPGVIDEYNNNEWINIIGTYVHEFIHTVDEGVTARWEYHYHNVRGEYLKDYTSDYPGKDWNTYVLFIDKLFLLNKTEYEGKTVGIPFQVWTNEMFTVRYLSSDTSMGAVIGDVGTNLRVAKGYDCEEVEAFPWAGYRFIGWSDGVTTLKRADENIQCDMEVTAYFEVDKYTINYVATEGGRIEGNVNQTLYGRSDFEPVIAIAEDGYRFVGWSDGEESSRRYDGIDARTVSIFNENNNHLVVTAIFEKIIK